MATMIYSALPSNHAERETFNALKGGPDDWVVFYSAKVPQQDSPRPRQIDFVILTGVSAICLEVKGGTFSRRNSQWFNGKGKSVGDPIDQAESAMYTLKNHAVPELGRLLSETSKDFVANRELLRIIENDLRFEYALLLAHPNMVGAIDPPKRRDGWLLLDASHLDRLSRMYDALSKFARDQMPGQLRNRLGAPAYQARLGEVRDLFRMLMTPADFDGTFVRVNKGSLRNVNEQLLRLTEQQERAFRSPQNNDRVAVEGAAGTGKTILALGLARWYAATNKRTLLVGGENRNMESWMRQQGLAGNVVLTTIDDLIPMMFAEFFGANSIEWRRAVRQLNALYKEGRTVSDKFFLDSMAEADAIDATASDLSKQDEAFLSIDDFEATERYLESGKTLETRLANLVKEALRELPGDAEPPFDRLVVDEAQSISRLGNLSAANALLKGGWTGGKWTILGDFGNQNLSGFSSGDLDVRDELQRLYPGIIWSKDRLTVNCRNTRQIVDSFSSLALPGSYERSLEEPDGTEVYIRCLDDFRDLPSTLDEIVHELRQQRVPAKQVVLLGHQPYDEWCANLGHQYGGWTLHDISHDYGSLSNSKLNYCFRDNFQGLESDVVIAVLGMNRFGDVYRRMTYTTLSRAKGHLIIIAHSRIWPLPVELQ